MDTKLHQDHLHMAIFWGVVLFITSVVMVSPLAPTGGNSWLFPVLTVMATAFGGHSFYEYGKVKARWEDRNVQEHVEA